MITGGNGKGNKLWTNIITIRGNKTAKSVESNIADPIKIFVCETCTQKP